MSSTHRWMAIGAFIRTQREQFGCSVETLARAISRSAEYVERLESGSVFPPIRMWEAIGSALKFNPTDGIRVAAESIPPLTPESRERIVAAVDAFIERQRVFLRGKREARGLTFGDVATVVEITPTEAEDIEHGRAQLFGAHTEQFLRFSTLLEFTFDEWMAAVYPPRE